MQDKRYSGQPRQDRESAAEAFLKSHTADILNFRKTTQIDLLLTNLKAYVNEKGGSLTTSQLRNIFAKVKPIRSRQELQLVRPKLAYVAARQKSGPAEQVVNFLENLIQNVEGDEQVKDFIAFFESVVAYHKFYHGKKSA